ncbi:DNA methyltransferase [Vulcanisaeta sp. JCM 16159]|uniref:DNA methyltransferase n=1 Tax=Vulcanisaeta sp. JCM 16159 TaxID=1295371 RepID=UPI0006CF2653|nr:DNA methyltransferase [Vulcanisaeta sp. JCM 16159]
MQGKVEVLFRELVRDVPSTTYATHALYMYPAKFIPHVVRYVINKYTNPGDWVFDPFAGYGTVAIEASLTGRNAVLWDLNPIMEVLVKASTYMGELRLSDFDIDWGFSRPYRPLWSNINYWHPREFYEVLSRAWGFWHYAVPSDLKPVVAIPLLKVTRYFSYADLEIAKLYKSREAEARVKELLSSDWRSKLRELYWQYARETYDKIRDYQYRGPKRVELIVRAGVDSLNMRLDRDVDVLITSPPYLQAQEYIRSFKLELAWLGYGNKLTELSKHEIPYNNPPNVKVNSETYARIREEVRKLDHEKLLEIYDAYFKSLAHFLNNNHERVGRVMAIFVGPTKIRNIRVPIDEILREHLESLGWKHEVTLVDKIVSRRLFKVERNPATGLVDERTPTEHLLIMSKN